MARNMSDIIIYDCPDYSRFETGTINPVIAGGDTEKTYEAGTVFGKNTTTGKYAPVAPAATDGTAVAAMVLLETVTVPAGVDVSVVGLLRHARIFADELIWPSDITDKQKATAIGELAAVGIIG